MSDRERAMQLLESLPQNTDYDVWQIKIPAGLTGPQGSFSQSAFRIFSSRSRLALSIIPC